MLRRFLGIALLVVGLPAFLVNVIRAQAQAPEMEAPHGNPKPLTEEGVYSTEHYWPEAGKYPVPDEPYSATLRSVALEDLAQRNLLPLGIYKGTPQVI